jgi:hypothetical protein
MRNSCLTYVSEVQDSFPAPDDDEGRAQWPGNEVIDLLKTGL